MILRLALVNIRVSQKEEIYRQDQRPPIAQSEIFSINIPLSFFLEYAVYEDRQQHRPKASIGVAVVCLMSQFYTSDLNYNRRGVYFDTSCLANKQHTVWGIKKPKCASAEHCTASVV